MEGDCIVGVDLGASKIRVGVFCGGVLKAEVEEPTPEEGIAGFLAGMIRSAYSEARCGRLLAIGIASVGPIDYGRPAIVGAPNLGEGFVDLRPHLERLGAPVIIANDAVAALWAEAVLGKARGQEDAAILVLGTGVGGAAMIGRRLVLGRRGGAHEVGHIVIDYDSRHRCGCGGVGHWEALAGGRWLHRLVAEAWRDLGAPPSRLAAEAASGGVAASRVAELAREGDPVAVETLRLLARVVGAGIASISAVYDPETVYLAGGVVESLGPRFVEAAALAAREYSIYRDFRVEEASFGGRQALYGAYAIAYRPPKELLLLNRHPLRGVGEARGG